MASIRVGFISEAVTSAAAGHAATELTARPKRPGRFGGSTAAAVAQHGGKVYTRRLPRSGRIQAASRRVGSRILDGADRSSERPIPPPPHASESLSRRAWHRLRRYWHLAALCRKAIHQQHGDDHPGQCLWRAVADRLGADPRRHAEIRRRHHAHRQPRRGRHPGLDRAGLAGELAAALDPALDFMGGAARRLAVLRRRRHHPRHLGLERRRGPQGGDALLRSLCHPDHAGAAGRAVRGAAARHRAGRRLVRPGDGDLVHRHRPAGRA